MTSKTSGSNLVFNLDLGVAAGPILKICTAIRMCIQKSEMHWTRAACCMQPCFLTCRVQFRCRQTKQYWFLGCCGCTWAAMLWPPPGRPRRGAAFSRGQMGGR